MPMTAVEGELTTATGLRRKVGQSNSDYFLKLAQTVSGFDEHAWNLLSKDAQRWVNEAIKTSKSGGTIKGFFETKKDDDAPAEQQADPEPELVEAKDEKEDAAGEEAAKESGEPEPEEPAARKEDEVMTSKSTKRAATKGGGGKRGAASKGQGKGSKKAPAKTSAPIKKAPAAPAKQPVATKAAKKPVAKKAAKAAANGNGKTRKPAIDTSTRRSRIEGVRVKIKQALIKDPTLTLDQLMSRFGHLTRGKDYMRYQRGDTLHTLKLLQDAGVYKYKGEF
jgi:chemotaxis protein histidine kinase CheA